MKIKKIINNIFIITILLFGTLYLSGCLHDDIIVIYTSEEDYINEFVLNKLEEKLPDVKIKMQYYSSGTNAAKLRIEGKKTSADIFLALDIGYTEQIKDLFYDLNEYDTSHYVKDILPSHHKYHIWSKDAGCIVFNNKILQENGLEKPTCYEDLLKSEYKNLIIMPNPKSSGTGYYFYNSLYSNYGKEYTLDYFSKLSKQVKQFSESGSGSVKSVDKGEIAIALGMTFQAVKFANNNPDLEITYFKEGSPYSLYTMGIIKGKENKENVKRVYDVLFNDIAVQEKPNLNPEIIFKNQLPTNIKNYPQNIVYSKMDGLFDPEYKEKLLDEWEW